MSKFKVIESGLPVTGEYIEFKKTQNKPEIYLPHDNKYYAVAMMDIDVPKGAKNRAYIQWMVLNNGNDTLFKYKPPSPSRGTGLHRYVFYLFEQKNGRIEPEKVSSSREDFNLGYFMKRNNLKEVNMTYFYTKR
jgi:phosphatidylethanolamine-binding protein (PEBP) family uncharacterized protein